MHLSERAKKEPVAARGNVGGHCSGRDRWLEYPLPEGRRGAEWGRLDAREVFEDDGLGRARTAARAIRGWLRMGRRGRGLGLSRHDGRSFVCLRYLPRGGAVRRDLSASCRAMKSPKRTMMVPRGRNCGGNVSKAELARSVPVFGAGKNDGGQGLSRNEMHGKRAYVEVFSGPDTKSVLNVKI